MTERHEFSMTATETRNEALPLDYFAWRREWRKWEETNAARMTRTRSPFQDKNFLADAILGTWKVNGRVVELSEMTFPNLTERDDRRELIRKDVRGIGITWQDDTAVVGSFAELERTLGL